MYVKCLVFLYSSVLVIFLGTTVHSELQDAHPAAVMGRLSHEYHETSMFSLPQDNCTSENVEIRKD